MIMTITNVVHKIVVVRTAFGKHDEASRGFKGVGEIPSSQNLIGLSRISRWRATIERPWMS